MNSDLRSLQGPDLLQKEHQTEAFDCGIPALNDYLKKYAWQSQTGRGARTYVVTRDEKVVGYFTLAYGSVSTLDAPPRMKQGLGLYPIPILVLARLAIDRQAQKKGLGKALLKQALLKALKASDIAGLRAVLVHAKDQLAKSFYKRYGFIEFPSDEFRLYLLIKDIENSIEQDPLQKKISSEIESLVY
ncbi:MAG: GNAT family N-acetyltransferase [Gammaproteobacteria bacterium]|nr:GNAT family N-acetyltransferase [Gammaproteobacteria bacterium]MBP9729407.1 GNAT family N-acetyltransferase [Gammaproteobacteria bacterium]